MSLATAIKTGDLTQLPSRRDEDWRWTDLRGLVREIPPKTGRPDLAAFQLKGPLHLRAARSIVILNGHGVGEPDPLRAPLILDEHDPVVSIHMVSVAEGKSHRAAVKVVVPAGVKAVLLQEQFGAGAGNLVSLNLEIVVEDGARLERIVLHDDDPDTVTVSDASVRLGEGAQFVQTVLTSGAKRQRIETRVSHPGAGASVRMDGAYLLKDKRHADITTVVVHRGVDGTTSELVKGVVDDQARGVFQGRIVVAPGADRTDARMGHHALILSDKAEVDAKPELLINADDVACAHGNTVGALDEDALFYAEQRGIPKDEARAMLTLAFVGEVIDRIGHEGAREVARSWAAARLGGSDGL